MPNSVANTTNTKGNVMEYPFAINTKGRKVVLGGERNKIQAGLTLEGLRDKVRSWSRAQDRVDHSFPLNMFHFGFDEGTATLSLKKASGGLEAPMYFTRHGFGQVARELMPNRGGLHMEETVRKFEKVGQKMASLYMNLWASGSEKPRMLRTMRTKMPNGDVVRVARSLHSTSYAVYDNAQFIDDLLSSDLGNAHVLSFSMADNGMRLRFATQQLNEITRNKPIPMYEAWNGETGLCKTHLKAGVYKEICTNGLKAFVSNKAWNWRHYGDPTRIQQGVSDALHTLRLEADGLLRQYNRSLETTIDDAYGWMEAELARHKDISSGFVDRVTMAMKDPTSSERGTLANVIDGVTLAAQHILEDKSTSDLLEQDFFERIAGDLMQRGLKAANGGKILVTV